MGGGRLCKTLPSDESVEELLILETPKVSGYSSACLGGSDLLPLRLLADITLLPLATYFSAASLGGNSSAFVKAQEKGFICLFICFLGSAFLPFTMEVAGMCD